MSGFETNNTNYMTKQHKVSIEVIKELEHLTKLADDDREDAHRRADQALCKLLLAHGYADNVAAYNAIPNWFA